MLQQHPENLLSIHVANSDEYKIDQAIVHHHVFCLQSVLSQTPKSFAYQQPFPEDHAHLPQNTLEINAHHHGK